MIVTDDILRKMIAEIGRLKYDNKQLRINLDIVGNRMGQMKEAHEIGEKQYARLETENAAMRYKLERVRKYCEANLTYGFQLKQIMKILDGEEGK